MEWKGAVFQILSHNILSDTVQIRKASSWIRIRIQIWPLKLHFLRKKNKNPVQFWSTCILFFTPYYACYGRRVKMVSLDGVKSCVVDPGRTDPKLLARSRWGKKTFRIRTAPDPKLIWSKGKPLWKTDKIGQFRNKNTQFKNVNSFL